MMNYNISNQYIAAHRSTAGSPADNSDQSVTSVLQSSERSSAVALSWLKAFMFNEYNTN